MCPARGRRCWLVVIGGWRFARVKGALERRWVVRWVVRWVQALLLLW